MKLSCTSVMLPRWTLDETFDKLAAYGYDGVELRCRPRPDAGGEPSFWGVHLSDVSPHNVVENSVQIKAAAARSGIEVVALAPQCKLGDGPHIDKLIEGAIAINEDEPPMIRIQGEGHDRREPYQPQFDRVRKGFAELVEIARKRGVKILYEVHVGTVAVSASRTFELLRDLDPQHIGAIYDVPNMVRVGLEDTRLGVEVLGPYLAHCHMGNARPVQEGRDNTGAVNWKWEFCSLTEGVADICQIVNDLQSVNYQGYLSLEDFGPADDDDKVKEQGAYLQKVVAAA